MEKYHAMQILVFHHGYLTLTALIPLFSRRGSLLFLLVCALHEDAYLDAEVFENVGTSMLEHLV